MLLAGRYVTSTSFFVAYSRATFRSNGPSGDQLEAPESIFGRLQNFASRLRENPTFTARNASKTDHGNLYILGSYNAPDHGRANSSFSNSYCITAYYSLFRVLGGGAGRGR